MSGSPFFGILSSFPSLPLLFRKVLLKSWFFPLVLKSGRNSPRSEGLSKYQRLEDREERGEEEEREREEEDEVEEKVMRKRNEKINKKLHQESKPE